MWYSSTQHLLFQSTPYERFRFLENEKLLYLTNGSSRNKHLVMKRQMIKKKEVG
jgi:hypothetical protein